MADKPTTKSSAAECFESGVNWSKFPSIPSSQPGILAEELLGKLLAMTDLMNKHFLGSYDNRQGCTAFVSLKFSTK
jgi:hypothetical protein